MGFKCPLVSIFIKITERIENKGQGEHSSSIPFPVARSINEQYGHIFKTCVRIFNNQEIHHAFKVNNTTYNETGIFFADSSFFDIFNYSVSSNNKSCLSGINKVVLSKELALKYFGNENPIGKEITFEGKLNLIISGVVDNTDQNSHLSFNALISRGHTVLVVEHNMDVVKCADWVIDMGPEGGAGGGQIVATGTPEDISKSTNSWTGKYLKTVL